MPDDRPAIRFIDYMGDREDMEAVKLIGPYPTIADRNRDLARLASLPLGCPRYRGGQQFIHATLADQRGDWFIDRTVEPAQIAEASTVRGFHAAYSGWEDEPDECDDDWVEPVADPYEVHPDQISLIPDLGGAGRG